MGEYPTSGVVSADGSYLYVVNRNSDNVSIINTENNTVVGTIDVGNDPVSGVIFKNTSPRIKSARSSLYE